MFRAAFVSMLLVVWPSAGSAQTVDPSGHWVGVVSMPNMELGFEVDLAVAGSGQLTGTLSMPAQRLFGLPLTRVQFNGPSILFEARTDQGFAGTLAADSGTMTGYYSIQDYTFPFTLKKTGPAKIEPPARNAAVNKDFEGTWSGTLLVNNVKMRLLLKVANRPDGSSVASFVNLDQGSLEIPAASITSNGRELALGFRVIEGSFVGTLNADHSELTGTLTQGGATAPVALTRNVIGR